MSTLISRCAAGLCVGAAVAILLWERSGDYLADFRKHIAQRVAAEYERARIGDPGQ